MTSLGLIEFTPTISFYDGFLAISLEIAVWIRFILGMLVNHRFTQDWLCSFRSSLSLTDLLRKYLYPRLCRSWVIILLMDSMHCWAVVTFTWSILYSIIWKMVVKLKMKLYPYDMHVVFLTSSLCTHSYEISMRFGFTFFLFGYMNNSWWFTW